MEIKKASNLQFGSRIYLEKRLKAPQLELLKKVFKPDSFNSVVEKLGSKKRPKVIVAISDKNDWAVEDFLNNVGVKIQRKVPSIKHYTERFKGNVTKATIYTKIAGRSSVDIPVCRYNFLENA